MRKVNKEWKNIHITCDTYLKDTFIIGFTIKYTEK